MKRLDQLMSTSVLSGDETHAMLPATCLSELFETAQRYEEALNQIIAWGPLGSIETAAAAGQAFQFMAKEALEK